MAGRGASAAPEGRSPVDSARVSRPRARSARRSARAAYCGAGSYPSRRVALGFNGGAGAQSAQPRHSPDWNTVLCSSVAASNQGNVTYTDNHEGRDNESIRARAASPSGLAGLCNQLVAVCRRHNTRCRTRVARSPSAPKNARPVSFLWVRPTPGLFDRLSGVRVEASTLKRPRDRPGGCCLVDIRSVHRRSVRNVARRWRRPARRQYQVAWPSRPCGCHFSNGRDARSTRGGICTFALSMVDEALVIERIPLRNNGDCGTLPELAQPSRSEN